MLPACINATLSFGLGSSRLRELSVCKNPSTILIALPRSLFNLAHTNDVDQLRRCGDALVVSVHGKHARSKNFSMPRSQMMAEILFNVQVVH